MYEPQYDVEVTVMVKSDATITVNDDLTALSDLARALDSAAAGKRAKVDVFVYPPAEGEQVFLDHLRAVQDEVRRAHYPVFTRYQTIREDRDPLTRNMA